MGTSGSLKTAAASILASASRPLLPRVEGLDAVEDEQRPLGADELRDAEPAVAGRGGWSRFSESL